MARTSKDDPIEKFRFRVHVINIDLSVKATIETLAGSGALSSIGGKKTNKNLTNVSKKLALLGRSGFSEVTLPKVTINEMTYRENIDAFRFSKGPGLVRYEPVVFKRGVTSNRDLYDWYRLVNEELLLLSVAQELSRDTKMFPLQSENFRRDIIIEVLSRDSKPIKAWYLFNAFPIEFSPGDSLNAMSDEKLIEEIKLTYEFFLELEGGLAGFAKEIAKGALERGTEVAAEQLNGFVSKKVPFIR